MSKILRYKDILFTDWCVDNYGTWATICSKCYEKHESKLVLEVDNSEIISGVCSVEGCHCSDEDNEGVILYYVNFDIKNVEEMVRCRECGYLHELKSMYYDESGWHTKCPTCGKNTLVKLPNYNLKLQELFDYCRGTEIVDNMAYWELKYRCNPTVRTDFDTVDSCDSCPKAGCHIHTAAQDAEMILNGEKTLVEE